MPLKRINDPDVCLQNNLQVASLLDLAGCKVEVVQHRAEAKDYRDIAALMDAGFGLKSMLAAGRAVYGSDFEPSRTLRALKFFDDGNLRELEPRIQTLLNHEVSALRLEDLMVLAAHEGLTKQEAR